MSDAKPKSLVHKDEVYMKQNRGTHLTVRQERQIRKSQTRLYHQHQHEINNEKKRNARQRFREWMSGLR